MAMARRTVELSEACRWVLSWTADGRRWHHTAYLTHDGLGRMREEASHVAAAQRGNPDFFMYVRELCVADTRQALDPSVPEHAVGVVWPTGR